MSPTTTTGDLAELRQLYGSKTAILAGLIRLTDDADEVAEIIQRHYAARTRSRGPRGGNGRDTP